MSNCPTCGRLLHRIKAKPAACVVCGKQVPWSGRGRPPKTHPECRGTWAKMRAYRREENDK